MKKVLFVFFIGAIMMGMMLSSCEKETLQDAVKSTTDTNVSFSNAIVKGIFEKKCITCHSPSVDAGIPDFTSSGAYATVTSTSFPLINTTDPSQSLILTYHFIDNGGTTSDQNNIIRWIRQGTKNN